MNLPLIGYRGRKNTCGFKCVIRKWILFRFCKPPVLFGVSAARAILATIGKDSAKHSGVISLFDKFFVKEGKLSVDASRIFHELKDYREKADYADYPEITKEIANNELLKAQRFLNEAKQYIEGYKSLEEG